MSAYLRRMKAKEASPPRKPMPAILWSWLGSLAGISMIGVMAPLVAGRLGLEGGYVIKTKLEKAMEGHVLGRAQLGGTYQMRS